MYLPYTGNSFRKKNDFSWNRNILDRSGPIYFRQMKDLELKMLMFHHACLAKLVGHDASEKDTGLRLVLAGQLNTEEKPS